MAFWPEKGVDLRSTSTDGGLLAPEVTSPVERFTAVQQEVGDQRGLAHVG